MAQERPAKKNTEKSRSKSDDHSIWHNFGIDVTSEQLAQRKASHPDEYAMVKKIEDDYMPHFMRDTQISRLFQVKDSKIVPLVEMTRSLVMLNDEWLLIFKDKDKIDHLLREVPGYSSDMSMEKKHYLLLSQDKLVPRQELTELRKVDHCYFLFDMTKVAFPLMDKSVKKTFGPVLLLKKSVTKKVQPSDLIRIEQDRQTLVKFLHDTKPVKTDEKREKKKEKKERKEKREKKEKKKEKKKERKRLREESEDNIVEKRPKLNEPPENIEEEEKEQPITAETAMKRPSIPEYSPLKSLADLSLSSSNTKDYDDRLMRIMKFQELQKMLDDITIQYV